MNRLHGSLLRLRVGVRDGVNAAWAARVLLLLVWAWLAAGDGARAEEAVNADKQFLRDSGMRVTDAELLAFLKQRTGKDEDLLQMEALVRRLGSAEFRDREDAAARLTALEPCALNALRAAETNSDLEVRRRARACIDEINGAVRWGVPTVVVRRLVERKPTGAVEALLRYLPYEIDEAGVEEVVFGLDRLTRAAGKMDAALLRALEDKVTARRAAAACVVGRR